MGSSTDKFINDVSDLHAAWSNAGGRAGTQLRFGQYVMNSSLRGLPDVWPELFYEEGPRRAYSMLYEYAHSLTETR